MEKSVQHTRSRTRHNGRKRLMFSSCRWAMCDAVTHRLQKRPLSASSARTEIKTMRLIRAIVVVIDVV